MKHVWNQVRRASAKFSPSVSASVATAVTAGAVAVMASSAAAENRPGVFETEFELGGISGGAAVNAAGFDVSSAAAKWEQSIGEYLEGLVDEGVPAVEPVQAPADDFVANEVEAFAVVDEVKPEVKPLPPEVLEALGIDPAEVAEGKVEDVLIDVPARGEAKAQAAEPAAAQAAGHAEAAVNPLLLAPVLSHPVDCELCRELGRWTEVSEAEPLAAPAEGLVDDMAAWEKLAEWASARVSGNEAAQSAEDDVAAVDGDEDDSSLAD